jgi:indolepyruvate ferredoxin oxidoreductase
VSLTERYRQESGRHYLTGIQALVRLPLDQMRLDRKAGLNTAAFITGYEGSPLGAYDLALSRVDALLKEHNVHFRPAVNEDLAATAVLGSQIAHVAGRMRVDGVVGIWYGKGPGVDRSGDALRHANLAGCPGESAALVLAGDDHACKSSSIPHQSDFALVSANIPILQPGNAQEVLDYGLYAIAMSRYSGAWCSLKLLTNVCDGGGTVEIDYDRYRYVRPPGYTKHTGAMLVPTVALTLERETNIRRLEAVLAFARANPINEMYGAPGAARVAIAASGKSYYDTVQALADLGVRIEDLAALGIRLGKVAMTYPLDSAWAEEFAAGADQILVIEEKRAFLEDQLKQNLYGSPHRPRIRGKEFFEPVAELDPDVIARVLAAELNPPLGEARVRVMESAAARPKALEVLRAPSYCPGCPHNRSTLLLEGQIAGGGIGCHGMGMLMTDAGRGYSFAAQMGSEGAQWIGMAPFVNRKHIFQNIGDGTLFHSGYLAIEAAVAAGVNITYRILYNGHVAMTGGQAAVGALPVPELTRKLEAEGVRKIVILAEDPSRYEDARLAGNAAVRDRSALEKTLAEMEREPGVTAIIYDQECAAEKRRKRSRGIYAEPVKRLAIHERVCEGCYDCVRESNCMSLIPVRTKWGEKMSIHQPSCNKDYSCALGDCPSFVTVYLKPGTGLAREAASLPPVPAAPEFTPIAGVYRIVAPGIGGTGVVTVNAILATAASMDGLYVVTLDQTGLAQKGGAVVSHLTMSRGPAAATARVNTGNADLLLGFDLAGAAAPENLRCAHPGRTRAVLNTDFTPTAEAVRRRSAFDNGGTAVAPIEKCLREPAVLLDATRMSEAQFGTHMMTNLILAGAAWQQGWIPISIGSIEAAIRLNGVDVERNLQAFALGRAWRAWSGGGRSGRRDPQPASLDERVAELTAYQNAAYAAGYREFVRRVSEAAPEIADAVAAMLFKLMAYKDEYEVARLLADPEQERRLRAQWQQVERIEYNLHPPLFRRLGLKRKMALGPWAKPALALLAKLKFVRGTAFDVFGYSAHRRAERELAGWYRGIVEHLLRPEWRGEPELALQIALLPDSIRGYEEIKERSMAAARTQAAKLLSSGAAKVELESR